MIITYSPGAARSFAAEFIQVRYTYLWLGQHSYLDYTSLSSCPAARKPIPQFVIISSTPSLLVGVLSPSNNVGPLGG